MKLKGEEKTFWWHFCQVNDSKDIPMEVSVVAGVDDSDYSDQYFAMLTDKVKIIHSIYLKETAVTDEGVKHISKVQKLKSLTLMKHPNITKNSLPYLNKLTDLEYLDIWRTNIILEDLSELNHLKNLKELYVSSLREAEDGTFPKLDNDGILEQLIVLEELFPNCTFYVDFKTYL
ncbi:Leucine Rich repeats (2 copies) [Chryseobacterium sp. MOF25P]|jgi:hypothetical protein|uniref:hypothetical protein n=1 Tax=unclassified Chryseobacterium TaxID=2593645 RepID=UPI000805466D|nr:MULTISPECIES: hypothetical protein [unclassified Chryseobacterium]OBW40493.1 Leucine Rich repeats (2 copies) [Chryseobacterium sp. MOF25P]OBW46763.1 Leucine Rich repeats (2 copies) [Chryseobacterium sp. BGARF1]